MPLMVEPVTDSVPALEIAAPLTEVLPVRVAPLRMVVVTVPVVATAPPAVAATLLLTSAPSTTTFTAPEA